ncbi:hypothetical protein RCH20_000399 [Psychrobacter sp. PL15]|nr:hypothetical protein [Psychrobacter sp. PL15]
MLTAEFTKIINDKLRIVAYDNLMFNKILLSWRAAIGNDS